jgi:hypothetical protein
MKMMYRSVSKRIRSLLSRALAFALLAGIVYGVTFGSAHRHGNRYSAIAGKAATGQAGGTLTAFHGQPRFECLACLFHQNLSNSTVPNSLFVAKPALQADLASTPAILSYSDQFASTPIARLSGRAPPLV